MCVIFKYLYKRMMGYRGGKGVAGHGRESCLNLSLKRPQFPPDLSLVIAVAFVATNPSITCTLATALKI